MKNIGFTDLYQSRTINEDVLNVLLDCLSEYLGMVLGFPATMA